MYSWYTHKWKKTEIYIKYAYVVDKGENEWKEIWLTNLLISISLNWVKSLLKNKLKNILL